MLGRPVIAGVAMLGRHAIAGVAMLGRPVIAGVAMLGRPVIAGVAMLGRADLKSARCKQAHHGPAPVGVPPNLRDRVDLASGPGASPG
jgi:hypothetical protein